MDILPMEPVDGAIFLQGDFREQDVADKLSEILEGGKVDVVISDMAPNLSGVAMVDSGASLLLNELALDFALEHLKENGVFVTKAFPGLGLLAVHRGLQKELQERGAEKARGKPQLKRRDVRRRPRAQGPEIVRYKAK